MNMYAVYEVEGDDRNIHLIAIFNHERSAIDFIEYKREIDQVENDNNRIIRCIRNNDNSYNAQNLVSENNNPASGNKYCDYVIEEFKLNTF